MQKLTLEAYLNSRLTVGSLINTIASSAATTSSKVSKLPKVRTQKMLSHNRAEVFNWNDFDTEADRPAPSAEYEKAITEALEVANGPKTPEPTPDSESPLDIDTVQLSIVKA